MKKDYSSVRHRFKEGPLFFGVEQAAEALEINTQSLRRLVRSGKLRAVRMIGARRYLIYRHDLLRFADSLPPEGPTEYKTRLDLAKERYLPRVDGWDLENLVEEVNSLFGTRYMFVWDDSASAPR